MLSNHGVDIFYVEHQGQFDAYAHSELKRLKQEYPQINYEVVLAYMHAPFYSICYKIINPSYSVDQFKETLATIDGMPILTPHCCRVTYVSIMQSLGVKLETSSHLVGHTTTRITENRYLRVQNEACQDALSRFD